MGPNLQNWLIIAFLFFSQPYIYEGIVINGSKVLLKKLVNWHDWIPLPKTKKIYVVYFGSKSNFEKFKVVIIQLE